MTIVTYQSTITRHVRGTRVEVGVTLYAVQKGSLYWIWSYVHRHAAERIDAMFSGPSDATDKAANWRKNRRDLVPSATK